jgi:hypothetical protein
VLRAQDTPKLVLVEGPEPRERPAGQRPKLLCEELDGHTDAALVLANLAAMALADLAAAALTDLDALLYELLAVTHKGLSVWWGQTRLDHRAERWR